MTRINIFLATAFLTVCVCSAEAQNKREKIYEVHFGVGAVNIFGDVGNNLPKIQISQTRPVIYAGGRYDFNEYFSAKVNIFLGRTAGTDKKTDSEERGYSFSASIAELSGQLEWNFLTLRPAVGDIFARRSGVSGANYNTRPYIFAGMGFVYSEPDFEIIRQDESVIRPTLDLRSPVGGFALPFGLGVRTDLSRHWTLGIEMGGRLCTSDYLDGIAIAEPKNYDAYLFTTLHLAYKFIFLGGKLSK
ncbi:MAG: porin family protein [Bacteroidales bacterium]|nr:porin family protein [Bacteroidales bacterium]